MKSQIHKATAEKLGIAPSKDGMYFCDDNRKITVKEHTEILMQLQADIKERHLREIEIMKSILTN